ncbi:MAG: tyrosine-type recombinase/integrase [Acidaminobacteraceae bacterium]
MPISSKIYPHVDKLLSSGYEYLISKKDGTAYNYSNYYRDNFVTIMKKLNMDHKPHDCRHTFATLMTHAKADTIWLQTIIGHANYETTANIYTHKDIDELKKAIDLI